MKPWPLQILVRLAICSALLAGCASTPRWPAIADEPAIQHMPGRWVWAELFTADVTAARQFYGDVFGWQFETIGMGLDSYTLIRSEGQPIAGIVRREKTVGATSRGRWLELMSVADVDQAVELATAAGAKVLLAPRDLAGRGRVAVLADPEGARFGVLRADIGDPPDVFPAVNTWLWRDLWAKDASRMAQFYRAVGGYTVAAQEPMGGLAEIHLEAFGYPRASILQVDMEDLPSAWLPYIRVEDLASTLARVSEAGGELLIAPSPEIREGRVAIIRDPLGAALGVAEWPEPTGTEQP